MSRGIEVVTVARLSQMRAGRRPKFETQTGGLLLDLDLVVEFLLHFVLSARRQALPVRANLAIR